VAAAVAAAVLIDCHDLERNFSADGEEWMVEVEEELAAAPNEYVRGVQVNDGNGGDAAAYEQTPPLRALPPPAMSPSLKEFRS
jgi:hypothetical protein